MNAKTPLVILLTLTLACLVLAGTYALVVRADGPEIGSMECKKTATPMPTEQPTDTPEPMQTSTLWTPQPQITVTPQPLRPTATPRSEKERSDGELCMYPHGSIGELFTLDDWRLYHDDPETLERHVLRESVNDSCIKLLVGQYAVLWWNEKTGHAGKVITVTVYEGNRQDVTERLNGTH